MIFPPLSSKSTCVGLAVVLLPGCSVLPQLVEDPSVQQAAVKAVAAVSTGDWSMIAVSVGGLAAALGIYWQRKAKKVGHG